MVALEMVALEAATRAQRTNTADAAAGQPA